MKKALNIILSIVLFIVILNEIHSIGGINKKLVAGIYFSREDIANYYKQRTHIMIGHVVFLTNRLLLCPMHLNLLHSSI